MTTCLRGAAVVAAFLFSAYTPLWAEPVTITSSSKGVEVTGELLSYDGQFIQIQTQDGMLTLDATGVDCVGEACPDFDNFVPHLRFSGSSRIGSLLLPALIEGYARSQGFAAERDEGDIVHYQLSNVDGPLLDVSIASDTTERGFDDLYDGAADVVMAAREVRQAEVTRLSAAGFGHLDKAGQSKVLALDALVPVTGMGQKTSHISMANLAAAFSGDITDWGAIGGEEGEPIQLYLPTDHSGFAQGFLERMTGNEDAEVALYREDSAADLSDAIARDPNSLGVLPFRSVGNSSALTLIGACGLRSVPRVAAVKTEDYPLTFPLFLYFPDRNIAPAIDALLDWFRTAEAQLVVRRAGFVDQGAVPIGIEVQGERLANAILNAGEETSLETLQGLVSNMYRAARLSPTFRFEEGSSKLDTVSRSSLLTLAQGIKDGRFMGRKLVLVGFSDGQGPAESNRALSEARALSVLNDLLVALGGEFPDGVLVETSAYGEALPIGCDDTEWGRRTNRRVELWFENTPISALQ